MQDFLNMLADMSSFSKCQKKVACYIRDNFDTAAFMTAERLAEAANVSESTVIRFASELGFNSFSGLRQALQSILRKRIESRELNRKAIETSVLRQTISKTRQSLTELDNTLLEPVFNALCDVLVTANNIYIAGSGQAFPLAIYAALSLRELRTGVTALHAADAAASVRQLSAGDVLIDLCTQDGEHEYTHAVRKRGAYVEQLFIDELPGSVHANDTTMCFGNTPTAVVFIDALCLRLTQIMKSGEENDTRAN